MTSRAHRKLQVSFDATGFFVLRTPLLPFEAFARWSEHPDASSRHYLASFFNDPAGREGLYLASPTLEGRLDSWLDDPAAGDGAVEWSLGRIFSRMTGRTIPFGLFAGSTVGQLAGRTRLSLEGRERYRRETSLDSAFLGKLLEDTSSLPAVRDQAEFRPNPTLYAIGGQVRYVERRNTAGAGDHYLCAISETPPLRAAIAASEHGILLRELARALPDDGASEELRAYYVGQLADMQLLVTRLEPPVTCDDPLHRVILELSSIPGAAPLSEALRQIRAEIEEADKSGTNVAPAAYRRMEERLRTISPGSGVARPFNVNLVKPGREMTIGPLVVKEALKAVELLRRIQPVADDPDLEQFKERFVMRFEARAVSLLTALDPDHGVAFGGDSPPGSLMEGLTSAGEDDRATQRWGSREGALLRMVEAAWRNDEFSIELSESRVERLAANNRLELPDAFSVFLSIAAASEVAVDQGDFSLFVRGAYGPSGAEFLGRFCAADEALRDWVIRHLQNEEAADPDALFAEIVHLPEAGLGNIVRRPILRQYEIPYLGISEAPAAQQIPVQDLVVQVVDDRFKLFSLSRGREVIPRLTTAHNYALRSPPVYRFLCALRGQGTITGLEWNWGPLNEAVFLPRITSGRIVLARARWRLSQAAIAEIPVRQGDAAMRAWRDGLRLPRFVFLIDDDRELPIDLENSASAAALVRWARQRLGVALVEMFPGPDMLPVHGPEGSFVHEAILPFSRRVGHRSRPLAAAPRRIARPGATSAVVPRSRPPGDGWLYFKFYGGVKTLDLVLADTVRDLVGALSAEGLIERWFYLRYFDPSYHLRVRLQGIPADLIHSVLPKVMAAAGAEMSAGRIRSVAIDTYEREIEKYGGPEGIEIAEQAFHADSEAALTMLACLPRGDPGSALRWRLALLGIDGLLDDGDYSLFDRRRLIGRLRQGFRKANELGTAELGGIGGRYRGVREELEILLNGGDLFADDGGGAARAACRSASLSHALARIRSLERSGRLDRPLDDIMSDLVHLRLNRVLISPDPREELVLYEYLYRIYDSRLARLDAGH